MAFHIVRNDITRMNVDVIVNSANPKPIYAYGTDLAIYNAAGVEKMLCERKEIGDIAPGNVAVTSAGGTLKATFVFHTVAPLWEDGKKQELQILRNCYERSLKKAIDMGCNSIAFPLLATGVYGFPKDKALEIAMSTIQSFLLQYPLDVFLVVFDEKSFVLSGKIFDRIQSYIDANYIEEAFEKEYRRPNDFTSPILKSVDERLRFDTMRTLAEKGYIYSIEKERPNHGRPDLDKQFQYEYDDTTFQELLFQYIDRSGLKPSDIYRPIEMSRQQYSRIQCNRFYQPKKNTALLLALVLHLTISETEDLLSRAGYAFNPSRKQDLIVKACILNGQYDLFIIDAMMQKNHLDTLIDYDGKTI